MKHGKIEAQKQVIHQNLLSNSGFGVWSNSTLENVGSEMTVTQITSGVCTTTNTQGLAVGKLVKFGAGGTTASKTYEVTAVTANTNFTIHDTSITDATDVTCYEVTPGCVAADTKAADGHSKTTTLDIWREYGSAYISGLYGVKLKKGADTAEYLNLSSRADEAWYKQFRGRTVTIGCFVYSTTATDNIKLQINDSDGTTESSFVGADAVTWVEITRTCGASITSFTPRILCDGDTNDEAYCSKPMLVFGSSIGEGNYQPIVGEEIQFETQIASNTLNLKTGLSDVALTTINLEADTNGKVPKGVKSILIRSDINDSGSAAGMPSINFYGLTYQAIFGLSGIANDARYFTGALFQNCNAGGDIQYLIDATGSGTFDINSLIYSGVKL